MVLAMDEVERIKNILRKGTVDALPELNPMVGKEYDDAIVETVLEELVKTAIIGQIDSAAQSQTVLSDSYYHITEKNKEKIINWIFEYTEKNIDDPMIIFLGFNLLLKLKWGELFVRYIGLYDELIKKEFDDGKYDNIENKFFQVSIYFSCICYFILCLFQCLFKFFISHPFSSVCLC